MSNPLLLHLATPNITSLTMLLRAEMAAEPVTPDAVFIPLLVIFLLTLLNALFVAAEFSIIEVQPTQLEEMQTDGRQTAVLNILNSRLKQDRYIVTAQLGITIATLSLAMYGMPRISYLIEALINQFPVQPNIALIRPISYVVALLFITYLYIVLGVLVPKSLALQDAPRIILLIARPMQIAQAILIIPVRLLNGIGNWLLRVMKISPVEGHARVWSPEEIELLVSESAEGGLLNEDEEEMIRNIFDFGERLVGQVMTPRTRVQTIPLDIAEEELLQLVTESRHSRFPVYENELDQIVGILHLKDLIRQTIRTDSRFDIRLILRSAPAVPEDYPVEKLLAAFKRQRLHMAIVLDEFGGMAGVVTLEDLVEEVVGEVHDEFDQEKEPFVMLAPGVLEVTGDYLVDDLRELVNLGGQDELPDVETLGGLVVTKLGRPPAVNDTVVYHNNIVFRVLDVDGLAVTRLRIRWYSK